MAKESAPVLHQVSTSSRCIVRYFVTHALGPDGEPLRHEDGRYKCARAWQETTRTTEEYSRLREKYGQQP